MPRISIRERFEALVALGENDQCWPWMGAKRGNGYKTYGLFWLQGQPRSAHRISWLLYRGALPSGKQICHTCDNGLCVNPNHLFAGTALDNARDMQKKGRQRYGVNPARGSENGHSKLTEAQVFLIKKDRRAQATIALEYGLHPSVISRIKGGKRWKHVKENSDA